ncbi:T9SS C-terminal target domain-containing protein, partial [bacterium AH-315-C20]|nr:T9SS C-terminal target domain-containing protein [bacterium AH-315-C20]
GCDVGRGLGYCYNGPTFDNGFGGQPGYGDNVPAIGIDFFEGPYQDNDGIANAIGIGTNQALNGIGYGDNIIDNERFGMRRFVYYDKNGIQNGDPTSASDYYDYMKGIWKNGQPMLYGGNGFSGTPTQLRADFMFPGDSDTANWGTNGLDPGFAWDEKSAGNPHGDRRFVQSAGPFTLLPGAINNITVGVVFGRSANTSPESAVSALKAADTKAQALFDNCFELVNPPLAPQLTIQEMENELILFLSDPPGVDLLDYYAIDKINIKTPDELLALGIHYNDTFLFEGFQIYQMKDDVADISQLEDLEQARLVAQCDLKNGVERLVNYTFDQEMGFSIPKVMVDGADAGISRSFRITEDQFATGDNKTLVNHKKYYYLAVSYGYNNFKTYDPTDPESLDGQKEPYLRSRISASGSGIKSVLGIPHNPSPENDGTIYTSTYGYQPEITQIEGLGNGGTFLELTQSSIDYILENNRIDHPVYKAGSGPIDVKVIDPLNLKEGDYTIGFGNDSTQMNLDTWWIVRTYTDENNMQKYDTISSEETIGVVYEQLILDWGLSVNIKQQYYEYQGNSPGNPVTQDSIYTAPIGATIAFADSSKDWLGGIEDNDGFYPTNWIRVGNNNEAYNHNGVPPQIPANPNAQCTSANWMLAPCNYDDYHLDKTASNYESLLDGTIAP